MKPLLQSVIVPVALFCFCSTASADYWISSTGKTHNSGCRYYQKGKGKMSANPSGVDCKVCKGAARARRSSASSKDAPYTEEGIQAAREYIERVRREGSQHGRPPKKETDTQPSAA